MIFNKPATLHRHQMKPETTKAHRNEKRLRSDTNASTNDVVGSSLHGNVSIIGRRREMEDVVTVELDFLSKGKMGRSYDFFAVYDGHGGWCVAHACSEMLHKLLVVILEEGNDNDNDNESEIDWVKLMEEGFMRMYVEVNKDGKEVATTGSTAVVAVVGEDVVVVANCGDSRAILSRGGVAIPLSDDHKLENGLFNDAAYPLLIKESYGQLIPLDNFESKSFDQFQQVVELQT